MWEHESSWTTFNSRVLLRRPGRGALPAQRKCARLQRGTRLSPPSPNTLNPAAPWMKVHDVEVEMVETKHMIPIDKDQTLLGNIKEHRLEVLYSCH